MSKILKAIIYNGIEENMSYGEQAKIKLVNIAIILAISNIIIYNFVYFIIDSGIGRMMVFSGSFFALPIIASIYLIKKRKYLIAKNLFLTSSTLVILFTSKFYLGPDFGFQTYFLVFVVMPYVAFSEKEKFFSLFYSIINMACYYYIQYGSYHFFMADGSKFYENGIPHIFNFITTLTAFSTVIIIMMMLNQIILADERILKRTLEKANYYAEYDYLTGIFNRRKISEILEDKCKNFDDDYRFVLAMCDIDCFKNINDYYGHPVGDKIISEAVDVIKAKLRSNDIIGRWGGEEFLIILSDLDLFVAADLIENIREAIEKRDFYMNVKVTMSFGLSEYDSNKNFQTIVSEADNFMYFAKESGRNRIAYK